jgi:hypothetical protein
MEPLVEFVGSARIVINKHGSAVDILPSLGGITKLNTVGELVQSMKKDGGGYDAAAGAATGALARAMDR